MAGRCRTWWSITRSLHDTRLKIFFRSVASDSESTSEVTHLRLRFSENSEIFFRKSEKIRKFLRKILKTEIFRKNVQFHAGSES